MQKRHPHERCKTVRRVKADMTDKNEQWRSAGQVASKIKAIMHRCREPVRAVSRQGYIRYSSGPRTDGHNSRHLLWKG